MSLPALCSAVFTDFVLDNADLNYGVFIAFSRNERTHPNLVSQASQAREIEIFCGLQIGRPCRFLQGLWASFSCPSVTSCLLSFVASFVDFDF